MKKLSVIALIALFGCTTAMPTGPSVAVMPAPGKPFEIFQQDDHICRQYAEQSVGTTANDAATNNATRNAAIGTGIGAVAGLLIGGNGRGAAVGAGIGLLGGAANGSEQGDRAGRTIQQRYDIAYEQCMYSKGNQLPGRRY